MGEKAPQKILFEKETDVRTSKILFRNNAPRKVLFGKENESLSFWLMVRKLINVKSR